MFGVFKFLDVDKFWNECIFKYLKIRKPRQPAVRLASEKFYFQHFMKLLYDENYIIDYHSPIKTFDMCVAILFFCFGRIIKFQNKKL